MKSIRLILSLLTTCPLWRTHVNVFACEPEWGALTSELGGNAVRSYTATTAMQAPPPH